MTTPYQAVLWAFSRDYEDPATPEEAARLLLKLLHMIGFEVRQIPPSKKARNRRYRRRLTANGPSAL